MQISRRESVLLMFLAVLVIIVFGTKWLVLPAYGNWTERKTQLAELELSGTQIIVNDKLPDNTAEIANEQAAFFVPETNSENLHRYFHGFIKDSGLDLENISISEQAGALPDGFSLYLVNLSVNGTQAQVMNFLKKVEYEKKSIAVESMSIVPYQNQNIGMVVSFHVYCIKNGLDTGNNFTPERPEPADGFRFPAKITNQSGDDSEA